ncbi:cbb3-type cytochrome c oxidase subunit I [Flavobacterium oreochromis]|uniref:Cytochrome oxidase subunit I profile domain-containing protein n=1 Tax=Flavobacterium columnare TaxID=996 RepID=A0A246GC03_9FLAO|nr:cbb3-type cytochrome c oxidase subunit I [Flavobacterium oreochromis]OWP78434.1 hypothetical protein BWK62_05155 [Flavobacterium oreochromis]POR23725.1 hypothetical protein BWK58_09835 [Flavobacterium columnare]QYS86172.1 cbb3-type cytochrome c oxidase subunit I [Flavobacterium oreochromis]
MRNKICLLFILLGLISLILGIFLGLLSSIQYVIPEFIKAIVPFSHLRSMHTVCVIAWIILTGTGGVYYYISKDLPIYSYILLKIHFIIFLGAGILILISYLLGNFGGKEYLEFPPFLIIPILLGWVIFGINYYKTLIKKLDNWPVYYWMWGTGIIFMIYHLLEAYSWLIPSVNSNFIKSLTIQWKAGGSFVGAWNMLIYGTAIYLMSKIKHDDSIGRKFNYFFFYFLGLTNLMFGWAHHIYIVPTERWIRYFAYVISMTEWIVLFNIIYEWKKSVTIDIKKQHLLSYQFLKLTDKWIFLNIILALLVSIPAINLYTHGTHITVAHAMGTTIGINTSILLASVLYIISEFITISNFDIKYIGYKIFDYSLFFFWIILIIAGIYKSYWVQNNGMNSFSTLHQNLLWVYISFSVAGVGLFVGLLLIVIPLIKKINQIIYL